MQKKLECIVKWLIIATFFVPLIVLPESFIFPFVVPKIIAFRILTVCLIALWALLVCINWRKYRVVFTATTLLVLAFLLSFSISTFMGVDWYRSFWDNHERMLGLFTITHYVLFYLVATSVVHEDKEWKYLFRFFLAAGSIVMFIALIQQFSPDLLLNQGSNRSSSTLGNSIYVGGYGLFLFFLGLLLFLEERAKEWKVYAAIGMVLAIIGILASGTRGVVVGLVVGLLFLCLYYAIAYKENKRARKIAMGILGVFILMVGFVFVFRHTEFVRKIPAVNRLVDTNLSTGSSGTRIMAWGIAIEAWKEKPVFGWGPNNFYYAFNQYYRPEFLEYGWGETWFDNAHNIVLNTLATQGVVGVIMYLSLFAGLIVAMGLAYRRGRLDIHLAAVGSAFLVAHLTQTVFVFENPTSLLYFFFFLAYLNFKLRGHLESGAHVEVRKLSYPFIGIVFAAAILFVYSTDINPTRANRAAFNALQSLYGMQNATQNYEKAVQIPTPHIDDVRSDYARSVVSLFSKYSEVGKSGEAKKLVDLAQAELNKNLLLHPLDIRNHITLVQLHQIQGANFGDYSAIVKAEGLLIEAIKFSPKRQQLQYMLSGIQLGLGKNEAAIKLAEQSWLEDKKIGENWWRLAFVYAQTNQLEKAQALIREAQSKNILFDKQGQAIADTILSTKVTTGTIPKNIKLK